MFFLLHRDSRRRSTLIQGVRTVRTQTTFEHKDRHPQREIERLVMEKEKEWDFFSRGVGRRACHVFMGGGWSQDRFHPPPKGFRMWEGRRRDVQRMRERENRDRHKLRVNFTIFSLFFSMTLGWGLNSTTSDQDITKSQMGVVTPTYPT